MFPCYLQVSLSSGSSPSNIWEGLGKASWALTAVSVPVSDISLSAGGLTRSVYMWEYINTLRCVSLSALLVSICLFTWKLTLRRGWGWAPRIGQEEENGWMKSSFNVVLNVHVCLLSTFLGSTWLVTATAVTASLSELAKVQWPSTMSARGNVRYIEKPKLISSAAVWLHQMKLVFTLDPSFTHPFFHHLLHTDHLLFHSFSHSHSSIHPTLY